ncbi:hypothetical protein [Virgibacillus profundi]|uniref:hypothetical protein n=1 Tax=Virgibacillus profundi TaxID=2024555 RepID=UPI0013FD5F7A|nr:hypothetical protein [Virgibacillus profundi]
MNNTYLIEKDFKELLKEQNSYREIILLTHCDMRTKIPNKGVEQHFFNYLYK